MATCTVKGLYTPLLLIHYKDQLTLQQATMMAKLIHTGDIAMVTSDQQPIRPDHHETLKVFNTSIMTRD